MGYGIKLHVWGDYACFTRPEMKIERVSYDVMTPSAARGILEAIHWKPAIRWVVDRIGVLHEVRFETIRRNEVEGKISSASIKSAMNGKSAALSGDYRGTSAACDAHAEETSLYHRSPFRDDGKCRIGGQSGEALQHFPAQGQIGTMLSQALSRL